MDLLMDDKALNLGSVALLVSMVVLLILVLRLREVMLKLAVIEQSNTAIESLKSGFKQHNELLNELKMVTQGMSQKLTLLDAKPPPEDMVTQSEVNALKQQLQQIEIKVQGLESQDPTSRLYTKASKLVASGASVEEIMQECDLPRAEAELVMSLHAKS
ncbi:DUF2802 domain-containing protein [Planctobacterium marinum]|uniref:DUF2802 domain-containing protein n=1 Tax=Planctobacterium marinum TaxID=1631968 RepID=A0AA48KRL7_9ALTE|nr:DUF2802 domain-containing protein [Planctobacterium marinum]